MSGSADVDARLQPRRYGRRIAALAAVVLICAVLAVGSHVNRTRRVVLHFRALGGDQAISVETPGPEWLHPSLNRTAERFPALEYLGNVSTIDIKHALVHDDDLALLREEQRIAWVHIGLGEGVTDAGLAHLSQLRELDALLVKDAKRVTGKGLAQLSNCKRLTGLVLSGMAESSVEDFARLAELRHLQVVNLAGSKIPADSWPTLAALRELEFLRLNSTPIADPVGLRLSFANLRELDLIETSVGDRTMAALDCPVLMELSLGDTAITDVCVPSLSKLRSLEYLNVRGTGVTPRGIAELARHLKLTYLVVDVRQLDQDAIEALNVMGTLECVDTGKQHRSAPVNEEVLLLRSFREGLLVR